MANLDEESLFSLELAVEEVSIHHNVPCRFPSVAFRLLDFPTLVIHHVNVELTRSIRQKIQLEPRYKPPLQFKELQDSSGNFPVRRGKSCLFRVSPNTLQAHLCNAPLYVMIMDTYPEVPKLIASCTVPLDSAINVLYDSVCAQGSSVPTVSVERGTYEVFNLMGKQLGHVTLAVRLLSLGSALLHHLPDNAVMRIIKQSAGKMHQDQPSNQSNGEQIDAEVAEKASVQKREAWIEREEDILRDEKIGTAVDAVIKNSTRSATTTEIPIDISPSFDSITTQTDRKRLENIGTQTVKKKHVASNQAAINIKVDKKESEPDLIITNVDCPPPLFYNSKYDEPDRDTPAYGPYEAHNGPYQVHNRNNTGDISSDDETIRTEDIYSDTEIPDAGFLQRKHIRSAKGKSDGKEGMGDTVRVESKHLNSDPVMKPEKVVADLSQFPILKALMSEIMKIQGVDMVKDKERFIADSKDAAGRKSDGTSARKGFHPSGKMAMHQIGPRKNSAGTVRMKNVYSTGQPGAKNKSWIRDQRQFVASPAHINKQPLNVAMTRTQRLRLLKTNPQLLAKLEGNENQRVQEFQEQERIARLHKYPAERLKEIERGSNVDSKRVKIVGFNAEKEREKGPQRRKPVPTPRASIVSGMKEAEDAKRFNERRAANGIVMHFADDREMPNEDEVLKNSKSADTIKSGWPFKSTAKVMSSTYKIDQRDDRNENNQFLQNDESDNNGETTMNFTQIPETTLLADREALDLRIKDIVFKQVSKILSENVIQERKEDPLRDNSVRQNLLAENGNQEQKGEPKTSESRQRKSSFSLVLPSPRVRKISGGGGITDRTQFEYSDDFEDFAAVTNRGADEEEDFDLSNLRMVVEKYSDESGEDDNEKFAQNDENDLGLERYVEHYPSDSEEENGRSSPRKRVISGKASTLLGKNALEQISEESQNSTSDFQLNDDTARSKMIHGSSSEYDEEDNDVESRQTDVRESKLSLRLGQGPNPEQSTWSPTLAVRGELESARQPIAGSSTPSQNTPSNLSSSRKPFSTKTSKESDGKKFHESQSAGTPVLNQSGDWTASSPDGAQPSPRKGTLSQELDEILTPTSSALYSATLEEGSSLGEHDDDDSNYNYSDDDLVVLGNGDMKPGRYAPNWTAARR